MRKLILLVVLLTTGAARAETVDEVITKNIAARGGPAKLREIKSLRLTGTIHLGGGDFTVDADWASLVTRSSHVRNEVTMQGLTQSTAYDGKVGWRLSPFGGRREAERLSADELKDLVQQADIDGALVDYRAKGHKVELLGTEDVDGTQAIKIRVTRKDGNIQYVFLDPDSYLEVRITTIAKVRGTESISESDFGGYQQVAGVWLPFSIESGQHGGAKNTKIAIDRAEVNVPVDDAVFAMPAAGAPMRVIVAGAADATAPKLPEPKLDARPVTIDSGTISGLGARNIGSATMSGRIAAVAARNEGGKTLVYVGAASGGVWKSLDGGTTFKPVFDKQRVQSIGAIAIDPTNSSTVWVGTGESWTRNSVSIGNGIYKSTDGGDTWTNVGLPDSERIVRILVHPKNSNVVYACVPGKLWSDSKDRGVYKTTDGGQTWSLVLAGPNPSTGCSGLTMDPRNPEVLFAGLWDFRRKGWTFRSGGDTPDSPSASALMTTRDGGKSWTKANGKGLPAGPWGRVEVTFAPSDARIVYAMIESAHSALFRSSDGGATWEARDHSENMVWRPFYFARLVVDPTNPERLFKPDLNLVVSEDGGATFSNTNSGSHGDWHDLWIDPENPKHVLGGDDGGLWLSWDGGNRWWKGNNLPISQFYHVSLDDKDPYNVYGGLQDNSSWSGPSAFPGGITNDQWQNLYNSDGFWTFVDPTDPDAVYAEGQGGYVGRVDRKTWATRDIQPKAKLHEKLRWNWNTPIHLSPTKKGTLYLGAQFLFRSRDRGDSWERISPDLTTNDPEKQKQEQSGGVTVDNSSAEMHTTIYSISESPKNADVIWVGTDDGNVQLTRDGGKTWSNMVGNISGLPKSSWVSWVEASRFDAGTAYAAFDRHTFGDMTPWVFRTTDYGKTWSRIVGPDQGVRGYAHVIKEDVVAKQLLFVGTELGLWISIDGGATWAEFKGGEFPAVAVRDLQIHPREHDLVLATHGRGIWIVDDITPLRALTKEVAQKQTTFLDARPVQQRLQASAGYGRGDSEFIGDNPRPGAPITYYLRTRHVFGPIKLEIFDAAGKLVDTLTPSKRRGINRAYWGMSVKPPRVPRAAQLAGSATSGPRVVPGTYTVRLTRGSEVLETKLAIGLDRRSKQTVADRKAQYDAVMKAHALFGDMTALTDKIDALRAASADRAQTLGTDPLAQKVRALGERLAEIKKKIVATKEGGAITGEERLREHLDTVYGALKSWDGKPAGYQVERVAVLRKELDEVASELAGVIAKDVKAIDDELKAKKLAPIASVRVVPSIDQLAIDCLESNGEKCGREDVEVAR